MGATALLFRGQRALRAGEPAKALEALDAAAGATPDSPHVALHRALALADAGRLDEALDGLNNAAKQWPANPVFPLFRGGLLAEADRLDEAAEALHEARKLSPGNLLAEAYLALVAMRRGEVERPLRHLAAVGMTDNSRALAAILAEAEAALFRRFGPHTDGKPPAAPEPDERLRRRSATRLAALGRSRLDHGDSPSAWLLLTLAAEKNPSLPDLFACLGFAAHDLGRYEEALDHLGRTGAWSKPLDAIHLHRGACLYKLGRHTEALEALHAAQAADSLGDYTAWIQLYLGRVLVALGRVVEARPHLRRLLDAEGDMALARLRQAR
ncbi:MAG: tetratricopeptide repeat protein, partial [Planctomycetes bacterium]|nr:tetratricopeptide repeat protein [Planctomycetota bacterium]